MTDRHTNPTRATRRLDRARLAPVGGRTGARIAAWAAGSALLVGGALLAYAALRPVAPVAGAVVEAPSPAGARAAQIRPLESRQRDLDALVDAANLFAPDRLAWPSLAQQEAEAPTAEEGRTVVSADNPDLDAPADATDSAGAPSIDSIPISTDVSAAVMQRLRALTLVGLYGVGDQHTAIIRDSTLPVGAEQTHHYRAGDAVGAERWELLAVDARRDRVILRRAGQNLELRMYPETVALAALPGDARSGEAPSGPATPESVRRDLEAAGVPAEDIAELLRLATGDEPLDGDPAPPAQADAGEAAPARPGAGRSRAMPPEMSALLRAMARDAAQRRSETKGEPAPAPAPAPPPGDGQGGDGGG